MPKGWKDFELARQLGPVALVRLRAETLLQYYDDRLTDAEREELIRIASAPHENDREYLEQFDDFFEDDDAP